MSKILLNDVLYEALSTQNYSETAKTIKKRYNLNANETAIRTSLSILKEIAERDNILRDDILALKRQTLDKNGEIISETYGTRPNEVPSVEGMTITAMTTRPSGGAWVKYKASDVGFWDDTFLDDLVKRLDGLPTLEVPKVIHNNKTLVLMLSDRHIGASLQKNALYKKLNDYKPEEYKRRLQMVAQRALWYKQQFGAFEKLVVVDLGDLLDGYNNTTSRGGHKLIQNLNDREQFDTYVDHEIPFWDWIVNNQIANNYEFYATSNSNHDGKGISYAAFRSVAGILNVKYPQIKTTITNEFLNHFYLYDIPIGYTHGKDEEFMRKGFPLNLNDNVENRVKQYCEIEGIKGRLQLYKGDLHQSNMNSGKFIDYYNVASMFGSSGYVMVNYGYSPPAAYFAMYEHNCNAALHDWYNIPFQNATR